jgi:hypothetical protein
MFVALPGSQITNNIFQTKIQCMKIKMPIWTLGVMMLFAACKGKDSANTTNGDTTTTSTTNTNMSTNEGMNDSNGNMNGNTNGNMNGGITNVPTNIRSTFDQKYPQASGVRWNYYNPSTPSDVDWTWTGWPKVDTNDYVVNYNWNNGDYMSWYDDRGNWVGTVNTISDYSTLPAPINKTISSQYKDYTISSVKRENDKNRTAYEIMLNNTNGQTGRILIDENGKIMKKKMGNDMKTKMNPKDSAQ